MKITRATVKSFIKNNRKDLYINCKSSFSGMSDMVEQNENAHFQPIKPTDQNFTSDYNFGIQGLWLVGSSRDSFNPYNDGEFKGIDIYNSCGSMVIAVKA